MAPKTEVRDVSKRAATYQLAGELTVGDLWETHEHYDDWVDEWKFLRAAYKGAKALVDWGCIKKHERESNTNFDRRVDEAYGFGYSKSVVDLFVHYLHKEPVQRSLGKLDKDDLWEMFLQDCDLEKRAYEEFIKDLDRDASVEGCSGVLIDKPSQVPQTREQELKLRVYPYVSSYKPQNILDFKYERDEFNRPFLSFLKLKDSDDRYLLWTTTEWQIWMEPEVDENGADIDEVQENMTAVLVDEGINPLGEIPFIWLYNEDMLERGNGVSDITDIARLDASVIRNLSEMEEVIDYAAFPMLRKPKPEKGEQTEDVVSVTAILEFDPDKPESKPDWLDAPILEPIEAIIKVVDKKAAEIYRSSNAGGMAATEIQTDARSGVALQTEFQLLNSKLVNRGNRLTKVEEEIVRLWKKFQKITDEDDIIERATSYDVSALAQDLDNALTAKQLVQSDTFKKKLQKKIARQMLPAEDPDELKKIDEEIDAYVEPDPSSFPGWGDDGGQFGNKGGQTTNKNKDKPGKPAVDDKGNVVPLDKKKQQQTK